MTATNSPRTLLLGCGYTLSRVARQLGHDAVFCTTNSPASATSLAAEGFLSEPLTITNTDQLKKLLERYPSIETIVDGVPPILGASPDTGTNGPLSVLAAIGERPIRTIYLSTTGVYGERNGAIVTESTAPQPAERHAAARLACEEVYRARGPLNFILRVAGIYGPGRSILDRLVRGEYRFVSGADRWTNRIHVDDLATAISRLVTFDPATDKAPPPLLNASDNDRMRVSELIALCGKFASFSPPQSIPPEVAHHTMLSNQRVDSSLLQSNLLQKPRYPNLASFLSTV